MDLFGQSLVNEAISGVYNFLIIANTITENSQFANINITDYVRN